MRRSALISALVATRMAAWLGMVGGSGGIATLDLGTLVLLRGVSGGPLTAGLAACSLPLDGGGTNVGDFDWKNDRIESCEGLVPLVGRDIVNDDKWPPSARIDEASGRVSTMVRVCRKRRDPKR
jgi:hypothetical protein